MKLSRIVKRGMAACLCFLPLLLSSCYLVSEDPGPNGKSDISEDDIDKADTLYQSAGEEYDKGNYVAAYDYSRKAFDIDGALTSEVLMGWSLLHLRRFDDFTFRDTGIRGRGARTIFKDILIESPNEFRARLGMATIEFYEHYSLARRAKAFIALRRRLRGFLDDLALIPTNEGDVSQHPAVLTFRHEWNTVGGFAESYRKAIGPKDTLSRRAKKTDEQPEPGPKIPNYPGWAGESLTLDSIPVLVKNGRLIGASAELQKLMAYNAARAKHWETRSIAKVESALKTFIDLEARREGRYHYILRDIGLAYVAIGNFYLQNEIDRARVHLKRQEWFLRVPDHKQNEVILSTLQDPKLFKSDVRPAMNRQFAQGIAWLRRFVDADIEAEKQRYENVAERELAAENDYERDYIDQEQFEIHKEAVRLFQREQSAARKNIILQVLTLMIYPQFGNERLDDALALTNVLETTDLDDPIPFMIRGVIYRRLGEWQSAIDEFSLYLSKASIATDGPRMDFARRAKIECELELEKIG